MDKHTCKLCFRRFHNGRALGGHMRSHVMAAAAAAAAYSPPISLASTSSTEVDDVKATQQAPVRDSSKKCFVKVGTAPEFCGGAAAVGGESSIVQDGQSDTESSPRFAVSRRRSKRARRRAPVAAVAPPDPEPARSSLSDATTEEDVAMSLVMLSRDSWARSSRSEHDQQRRAPASSEPEQNNTDDVISLFDDDVAAAAATRRGRFECGACGKAFRSYQALGGHRASIKKGKGGCVPQPQLLPAPSSKAHRNNVVHECPFCFRVFESGQALGGHKRAHMAVVSAGAKCGGDSSGSIIDLNAPPAATDDDFELSAVYDAEFGSIATRH
ncbi:hypothetical protein QOZ80_2BG0169970 [Eleusine coracana subsp. coracana]|nr:hypothetical protein QOZ80_2BG0169970 [Eleusine coracana subsp. coracana]